PLRWLAIKLLENDKETKGTVARINSEIVFVAERLAKEIETLHKEPCSIVIAAERYSVANRIVNEAQKIVTPKKVFLSEKFDALTTHKYLGYPLLAVVVFFILAIVFLTGNIVSNSLIDFFESFKLAFENIATQAAAELVWNGIIEGLIAGITIVLPYIIPFYIILGLLEDSGYLPRVAFLVDSAMHKIGLHGKAFIPFILGYGCNVPACLGCRVMETERERTIAVFATTMVPCAARTLIILGLVGTYLGFRYALALYAFNLIVIFLLGRIAFKVLPGEPMGLIMEMPPYRKPILKIVLRQTWHRTKDFIIIAFPLIIAGSFILTILKMLGLLTQLNNVLSPITVHWLGLPAVVGSLLIFGILRKELALTMLAAFIGTENFALVLTPVQMLTFTIVTMFYIPCVATIAALVKELRWKKALIITIFEIGLAMLLGGLIYRILSLF
ncbi:MAG: ferrous iron transporter B, partial [Candidatus Thermoplasmatota archaeon]